MMRALLFLWAVSEGVIVGGFLLLMFALLMVFIVGPWKLLSGEHLAN